MTTCYDPMTWYAMITCRDVVTCRHVLAYRDMPVCLHTMTRPGIRSAIAYLHMLTSVDRDSSGRVGRAGGDRRIPGGVAGGGGRAVVGRAAIDVLGPSH